MSQPWDRGGDVGWAQGKAWLTIVTLNTGPSSAWWRAWQAP
jgi:hypothetical protein